MRYFDSLSKVGLVLVIIVFFESASLHKIWSSSPLFLVVLDSRPLFTGYWLQSREYSSPQIIFTQTKKKYQRQEYRDTKKNHVPSHCDDRDRAISSSATMMDHDDDVPSLGGRLVLFDAFSSFLQLW